MKSVLF